MTIKNLQDIPVPIIVDCLLDAFSNYFVQMPRDVAFWEKEVCTNNVDAERTDLIRDLGRFGLVNTVDQFEMEMR